MVCCILLVLGLQSIYFFSFFYFPPPECDIIRHQLYFCNKKGSRAELLGTRSSGGPRRCWLLNCRFLQKYFARTQCHQDLITLRLLQTRRPSCRAEISLFSIPASSTGITSEQVPRGRSPGTHHSPLSSFAPPDCWEGCCSKIPRPALPSATKQPGCEHPAHRLPILLLSPHPFKHH